MKISLRGLGAITPLGDATLHNPLALTNPDLSGSGTLPAFELKNYLESPKTYLDRSSALALAGCALALRDAGLEGPFDEEFGLALGTEFGCVETMRGFENKLAESGSKAVSPLLFSHSYFNSPASLCAIEWGLKGYHATVCGPRAGLEALQLGVDAIRAGHASRMLAGAVEAWTPGRELGDEGLPLEGAIFVVLEAVPDGHPGPAGPDAEELLRALLGQEKGSATDEKSGGALNGLSGLVRAGVSV